MAGGKRVCVRACGDASVLVWVLEPCTRAAAWTTPDQFSQGARRSQTRASATRLPFRTCSIRPGRHPRPGRRTRPGSHLGGLPPGMRPLEGVQRGLGAAQEVDDVVPQRVARRLVGLDPAGQRRNVLRGGAVGIGGSDWQRWGCTKRCAEPGSRANASQARRSSRTQQGHGGGLTPPPSMRARLHARALCGTTSPCQRGAAGPPRTCSRAALASGRRCLAAAGLLRRSSASSTAQSSRRRTMNFLEGVGGSVARGYCWVCPGMGFRWQMVRQHTSSSYCCKESHPHPHTHSSSSSWFWAAGLMSSHLVLCPSGRPSVVSSEVAACCACCAFGPPPKGVTAVLAPPNSPPPKAEAVWA